MTLDGRSKGGLGGFYLQSASGEDDAREATSEGLFVYTRSQVGAVGDRIRVQGRIKEYYGLTEMAADDELSNCGRAPLPESVTLTSPGLAQPETLEGMRVRFDHPLTVISTHQMARFGLVTLADSDPVRARGPASQESAHLLLDDRRLAQNPSTLPLPAPGLSASHSLRTGSQLEPIEGVLDFRYKHWRIQPDRWPSVVSANPRPAFPDRPASGDIRIASFNVLNFFNGNGHGGGFPTARGADSQAELGRQQAKLVSAIRGLQADIVGLMELENDGVGPDSAIAQLTAALGDNWAYIPALDAGSDAIRVGLIYRADHVAPVGGARSLTTGEFGRYSRAPLAQDFHRVGESARLRIVANHFKSRSCRNARKANRAQGDGEGCYAPVRTRSASQLTAWLADLPGADNLAGTVVLGDLNSYTGEAPLKILSQHSYRTPEALQGAAYYTYRFRGVRGALDHLLVNDRLAGRVTDGDVWHINADEPTALDYNLEFHPPGRAERLYAPTPWRSSDHDPVYLDISAGQP